MTRNRPATLNARLAPLGGMDVLSRAEVTRLRDASQGGLRALLRRCALAVLASGVNTDDPKALLELFPDFEIEVRQRDRGLQLVLSHAPAEAFVDAFLEPPLHSTGYADGFGTLYTAVYRPMSAAVEYRWPDGRWRQSVDAFETGIRAVRLPSSNWSSESSHEDPGQENSALPAAG